MRQPPADLDKHFTEEGYLALVACMNDPGEATPAVRQIGGSSNMQLGKYGDADPLWSYSTIPAVGFNRVEASVEILHACLR